MGLPGVKSVKEVTEQSVGFMEWTADQLRKKSWPTLLTLLGVALLLFGAPASVQTGADFLLGKEYLQEHPLPTDYKLYWGAAVAAVFLVAFVVVYRTRPRVSAGTGLSLGDGGAIKGLLSFVKEDAEIFERLGRNSQLRFCLDAVCTPGFRFGILQGESGCGKSSLLAQSLRSVARVTC